MATFEEDFSRALESKLATAEADRALTGARTTETEQAAQAQALTTGLTGGQFAAYSDPAQVSALRQNLAGQGFGSAISRQPSAPRDFTSTSTPRAISFGPNEGTQGFSPLGFKDGGVVAPGDMRMSPLYKQYVKAMKNAGLGKSVLPPEQAIPRIAQQQAQLARQLAKQTNMGGTGAMGFADGGEVDVGGALLDGPGTAKSDSIPAMIDGEQPAALSKGEFVIPKKVVDYYGTKFLDAMVDKARMAMKKQAIA
jgi:hypothetical protein